ncbi:glycoside hydrolase family 18 protein [Micromonospora sp. WMMA1363]|uniref:glycoside hydrolase family 18 protein n=1 Tax=Micromonospora sp. WMMA1363 TaxID=3053985 RepID=UPI00259CF4B9|nr:glycoside hydrolase family 18 protein [Micromonospora sp. WMMA1363]MDM4720149.1 glycoside hydrolase family 18 protein [Micromonospora sp. WMMA1363]
MRLAYSINARHVRLDRLLTGLIASITAVSLLLWSTDPLPAQARSAAGDQVVTHDFGDPQLADQFRQAFAEIDKAGMRLDDALRDRTKGHLHDVMPDLKFVDFDHEWKVEGTVATITIRAPEVEVDATWWQGALITASAIMIGFAAGIGCTRLGGPPTACAGFGGFVGEFTNGALTQLADGKLGDAEEWGATMAKSVAAGLATFLVAWLTTAGALDLFQSVSQSIVRFTRTVEIFFGGPGVADRLQGYLDVLERYLPRWMDSASTATGVCRDPAGEGPAGEWTALGQVVRSADGTQTRFTDLDGDGDGDRAVSSGGRLYTWLNGGCGSDGERVWFPLGDTAPATAAQLPKPAFFGDLDRDGRDELVNFLTAAESPTGVAAMRVWRNLSSGTEVRWANAVIVANDLGYVGNPVFADLDGDTDDDLLIVDRNNFVTAWENKATGLPSPGDWDKIEGFSHPAEGPVGQLFFTDITGDGRADVVVVQYMTGDVVAWENLGRTGGAASSESVKAVAAAGAAGWESLGTIRSGDAFNGAIGAFSDLDVDRVSDFLLFNSTSRGVDAWRLPGDTSVEDLDWDESGAEAGVPSERVAYFNSWSIYANNYYLKTLDQNGTASRLTKLNYAFQNIDPVNLTCMAANKPGSSDESDPDGNDGAGDAWADYQKGFTAEQSVDGVADQWTDPLKGNFNQIKKLKQKHPNLKVLVSIGGWTYSKFFSDAAATDASRKKFVKSCVDMFIKGDLPKLGDDPAGGPGAAAGVFDGIDIDWEFPASPDGHTGNHHGPQDTANFTALLAEFRAQLGAGKLLTAALPAGPNKISKIEVTQIASYLDLGNIMTYDMHGAWEGSGPTNFNDPLYRSAQDPADGTGLTADDAITTYLGKGFPAGKITLGVPFYARGWTGVQNGGKNGLYQPATGAPPAYPLSQAPGVAFYKELKAANKLTDETIFWDSRTKTTWMYDGSTFFSIETPKSMTARRQYIKNKGLAGVMIYSLEGDDAQTSLLKASTGLN